MQGRLKAVLLAAAAAVFAAGALAVAQPGGEGSPPVDPELGSAYGECVSTAAEAGAEDPAAECQDLRPGPPEDAGGRGDGESDAASRFDELCGDESKDDGSFGKCVAEHASSFGKCVAANAEAGTVNPAAACAELRPGNGPPEGVPNGPPEGVPSGPPEGTPSGPPEGVPSGPPEGTPSGPPEGVPSGPPEGTPSGPPEGTPSGPPEGVPSGPPEGRGGGRPG